MIFNHTLAGRPLSARGSIWSPAQRWRVRIMVQENWTFVQALSWRTADGPGTLRAYRRSSAEAVAFVLTTFGHMGRFQLGEFEQRFV
jgi:hypothetical protein